MLNDLVLISALFFSGAVLPLAGMPAWARTVATPLFMTHAMAGLRTVMLDGGPLASAAPVGWPGCSPLRPPGSPPACSSSTSANGSPNDAAASQTPEYFARGSLSWSMVIATVCDSGPTHGRGAEES